MTVQGIGIQQQLQSSPHQHPCLIGTLGPLEEAVEEVVDGGIVVGGWWVSCGYCVVSFEAYAVNLNLPTIGTDMLWNAGCRDLCAKGVLED